MARGLSVSRLWGDSSSERALSGVLPVLDAAGSPASEAVGRAALAVTAHGSGSTHHLPERPLADAEFHELLALAEFHRLLGAVAEVVASGALPTTGHQHATVADRHRGWMTHALRVERLLLRLHGCFEPAGITIRVLKGVALAHLVYPDPAWRVFGDLDLLVRGDQLDAARRLADQVLGGWEPVPELRAGFDEEFGKDALVRVDGVELDLHRTFVTGPFGLTVDLDRLFGDSMTFDLAEHRFRALAADELFLHACYNAALGDYPFRLCSLRDLLLIHERLPIDLDRVAGTAREWGATAVVQRAARLTLDVIALDRIHAFAALAEAPVRRREALLLRSYLTPARSYWRPLASLAVIKGVRARARYLRALVTPSPEYLRSRGWTERSHLRRAVGRLRHRSRG